MDIFRVVYLFYLQDYGWVYGCQNRIWVISEILIYACRSVGLNECAINVYNLPLCEKKKKKLWPHYNSQLTSWDEIFVLGV